MRGGEDDRELDALLADERARAAAEERAAARRLRAQAAEEATLAGVLRDLAEERAAATLRLLGGRVQQGTVRGVGADYVALVTPAGAAVHVALAAVAAVEPGGPGGDPGARGPGERTLGEALARLADERPRVALRGVGGEPKVVGELRLVGADVVEVRADARRCFVALAAVAEAVVEPG